MFRKNMCLFSCHIDVNAICIMIAAVVSGLIMLDTASVVFTS
jgi:hypothetical protein